MLSRVLCPSNFGTSFKSDNNQLGSHRFARLVITVELSAGPLSHWLGGWRVLPGQGERVCGYIPFPTGLNVTTSALQAAPWSPFNLVTIIRQWFGGVDATEAWRSLVILVNGRLARHLVSDMALKRWRHELWGQQKSTGTPPIRVVDDNGGTVSRTVSPLARATTGDTWWMWTGESTFHFPPQPQRHHECMANSSPLPSWPCQNNMEAIRRGRQNGIWWGMREGSREQ